MIVRACAGLLIVALCGGCGAVKSETQTASAQWRMENLEQRFLDFRDRSAQREAVLEARIGKLEKELGVPGLTDEEVHAALKLPSTDVRVFPKEPAGKDAGVQSATSQPNAKKVAQVKDVAAPKDNKKKWDSVVADNQQERASKILAKKQPETKKTSRTMSELEASKPKAVKKAIAKAQEKATKTSASAPALESEVNPFTSSPRKEAGLQVERSKKTPAKAVTQKKPAQKKKVAQKKAATNKPASIAMYKRGLGLVNDGKHELGREVLEDFLSKYESSSLQPNAIYWIGESFYSQKDFRLAIDLFREVLRKHPASNKAAAAMLKIGYSYERLNEISEARIHLLKVVEKYPHSNEARLARNLLASI